MGDFKTLPEKENNLSNTIKWDDSYIIGNTQIDEQHQRLFEIAGELDSLVSGPDESKRVKVILNDLKEYMLYHFDEEEAFMAEISYPAIKEHKVLHQRFINDMRSVTRVPLRLNMLKIQIHAFVQEWLVEHIIKEDMKIQSWAQAQKKSSGKNIFNEKIFDRDTP